MSDASNGIVQIRQPPQERNLLPPEWEADREDCVAFLGAAYYQILEGRSQNFQFWHALQARISQTIQDRFHEAGFVAPPWNEDALWARIQLLVPATGAAAEEHMALVRALLTDYTARFYEHIDYRQAHNGNVHIEFTGPTGLGKSSCAGGLMDNIKPMEPDRLVDHLVFDLAELPKKLAGMVAGDSVLVDEFLKTSGEGSRTLHEFFDNLEDTLRASKINLFRCSPRRQDSATMQAVLELITWNPDKLMSLFLVWIGDRPHGVVALPWMTAVLYEVYLPWKEANVERSVLGQFRDRSFLAKTALRVCDDDRFVQFLVTAANKPKKADFNAALDFFQGQMMTKTQEGRLAEFLYQTCYNFERIEEHFESWFGLAPNDGLRTIARKCYKE